MRVLLIALLSAGCCQFSGPRWHGPVTDHFDGEILPNGGSFTSSPAAGGS